MADQIITTGDSLVITRPTASDPGSLVRLGSDEQFEAVGASPFLIPFTRAALAASLSDFAIGLVHSTTGLAYMPLPFAGRVVGIAAEFGTNVTAESITMKVQKNTAAVDASALVIANGTRRNTLALGWEAGIDFAANDRLSVAVTTPSGFTPAAANALGVFVLFAPLITT